MNVFKSKPVESSIADVQLRPLPRSAGTDLVMTGPVAHDPIWESIDGGSYCIERGTDTFGRSGTSEAAWSPRLGAATNVLVGSGNLDKKEFCANFGPLSWVKLGTTLTATETVRVGSRDWGKKECYVEALRINPGFSLAWLNLGAALTTAETIRVGFRDRRKKDCYVEALHFDPNASEAWNHLRTVMVEQETSFVSDCDAAHPASCASLRENNVKSSIATSVPPPLVPSETHSVESRDAQRDPPDISSVVTPAALAQVKLHKTVNHHRKQLAAYATSELGKEIPFTRYCAAVATALDEQLGVVSMSLSVNEERYPVSDELPVAPRNPLAPRFLPEHQTLLRPQGSTTVLWVRSLPFLSACCPLTSTAHLAYTYADVAEILSQLRTWAVGVVGTLQSAAATAAAPSTSFPAIAIGDATSRERLVQAVEVLHLTGADPHVVADEMIAVALCTIELHLMPTVTPALPLLHGPNRSTYAVMNHVCRVSREATAPCVTPRLWTADERLALDAALRLFAPIVMRVDTLLSRLPTTRRVLFRGVRDVTGGEYPRRPTVAWHQPSSASHDCDVARRFGSTMFTIHAHSTAVIDYLSTQPTEQEAMLPSFAVLRVLGATSPTLLRLLDVRGSLVALRELGDEPPIDDIIAALIESQRLLAQRLFARFTALYVEGTLSRQPPPVAPWGETQKLFAVLNRFVEARTPTLPLLLLGGEGTGKTSAMLAAYCHLSQRTVVAGAAPSVPIFIPLPQLSVHDSDALDRLVWEHLGVASRSEAEVVARRVKIVLLLDSLDESNMQSESRPLIPAASFCATWCRVIASCRAEAAHLASHGVVGGMATSTWHIQPLRR